MDKVQNHLKKFYGGADYNCAETLLLAANEAWELQMSGDVIKTMAGFGGGMASGGICGAVSGAVAALSYRYVQGNGHQSPELMDRVRRFVAFVQAELGSDQCRDLRPQYSNPDSRCYLTVELVARLLDKITECTVRNGHS